MQSVMKILAIASRRQSDILYLQVETMQLIPGVEVTAVAAGSSKEKAEGFAKEHGKAFSPYFVQQSKLFQHARFTHCTLARMWLIQPSL